MQESWQFVECSEALTADANFSSLTVKRGIPVNDLDKHARLPDLKRSCWLLWIDISGVPFTEAMFKLLLKMV